jgi:hypothetical protein
MKTKIKNADLFGRIGTGIGKGLADYGTKAIERSRLSSELNDLGKQKGLTPFQQFAGLASAANEYPQIVNSGERLLREQGVRNDYQNLAGNPNKQISSSPENMQGQRQNLSNVNFANLPKDNIQRQVVQGDKIPTDFDSREQEAASNKGLVKENPAQNKFIPPIPWTPEQKYNERARIASKSPNLTNEQINAEAADNEARYMAAPEAYRKQQDYLRGLEKDADEELERQLKTSLQKNGDQILEDIPGDLKLDLQKQIYNDLATNANINDENKSTAIKQVTEKWRKIGKDYVEQKNLVKEIANRDFVDRLHTEKKEENLKRLKNAQKSYEKLGRKKEFYETLRSDFDMSPGYAALIAYPRSESLKQIINQPEFSKFSDKHGLYPQVSQALSNKAAEDFGKNRTSGDSILAFSRVMKDKYPFFNERSFFDYLRENQDELNLSPDQRKELTTGVSDVFRNWGDLTIFPFTGRSILHD